MRTHINDINIPQLPQYSNFNSLLQNGDVRILPLNSGPFELLRNSFQFIIDSKILQILSKPIRNKFYS